MIIFGLLICAILIRLSSRIWRIENVGWVAALTSAFCWMLIEHGVKMLAFLGGWRSFPFIISSLIAISVSAVVLKGLSKQSYLKSFLCLGTSLILYWTIVVMWLIFLGGQTEGKVNWWEYFLGIP